MAAGADQNGPQARLQQIRILCRPDSPLYSLPVEVLTNHHKCTAKNNTSVLLPDSFWRLRELSPGLSLWATHIPWLTAPFSSSSAFLELPLLVLTLPPAPGRSWGCSPRPTRRPEPWGAAVRGGQKEAPVPCPRASGPFPQLTTVNEIPSAESPSPRRVSSLQALGTGKTPLGVTVLSRPQGPDCAGPGAHSTSVIRSSRR